MMRKKGLSLFLAVLMLLSMLAGFSLPAGAAVADLQAILEMHQEYDATLFEAEVQAQMLTFRAALEERIEAYLDEDIAGRKALISQSQAESEALLAAMNGGLRADAAPRYTEKALYAALGHNGDHYSIASPADWTAAAAETADGIWEGVTLHVTNDIDFKGVLLTPFYYNKNFKGTIDGHGHVFKNIKMESSEQWGACLVHYLGGTIKDLGIAGGSFKNTYNTGGNGAKTGAFTSYMYTTGVLYKCWSSATVEAEIGHYLGGLVGSAENLGRIISCYNIGKVKASADRANSLVGYTGNKGRIYHSIGAGAITASSASKAAMIYAHANFFKGDAGTYMPLYNSYAVGVQPLQYNGTPSSYEQAGATVNGHAFNSATLASTYQAGTIAEAAWKVNSNIDTDPVDGYAPVYFTLDKAGNLKFGSQTDRVVRIIVSANGTSTVYYKATGERFSVADVDGLYGVASGDAQVEGNVITAGVQDATVAFSADEQAQLAAAVQQLQRLLEHYNIREAQYFTAESQAAQQAWKETAQAALTANTLAAIQAAIEGEQNVSKAAAAMTYPAYPSVADYEAYADTAVTNFSIGTKEEWLAAVAMSNSAAIADAEHFTGATLHLTADIDMKNEPMLPLCYNGTLNGSLDGHGHIIDNINISITNPKGPVGLIAGQGKYIGRGGLYIQNLHVGGSIYVGGTPDYSNYFTAFGATTSDAGNKVGGILGFEAQWPCYLRNCRNLAEIIVDNAGNVGGIIGDGRNLRYLDQCINLGTVLATDDLKKPFEMGTGLCGYGGSYVYISNCINAGSWNGVKYGYVSEGDVNARVGMISNTYSTQPNLMMVNRQTASALASIIGNFNAQWKVETAQEAAYKINKTENYTTNVGDGARVFYTLDEKGLVSFGSEEEQIRKVTVLLGDAVLQEVYVAQGKPVRLKGDLGVNYFGLVTGAGATLKGNRLIPGSEDVVVRAGKNIAMGDANDNGGGVGLHDAVTILRAIIGAETVGLNELAGDVNQNGQLDANDAVLIARYWLGDPNATFDPNDFSADTEGWIKVASYNIKGLYYGSAGNTAPYLDRTNEIVEILRSVDADIVALQEIYVQSEANAPFNKNQIQALANALGYSFAFIKTQSSGTGDYGHGFLYRATHSDGAPFITLSEKKDYYFNDLIGANTAEAEEPRGFTRNVFTIDPDGTGGEAAKQLIFYGAHLATRTVEQLRCLNDRFMEADVDAGKPVLLMGDFNMDPQVAKAALNTGKFTALNGGDDFSTSSETIDLRWSIDNIVVSDNLEYYWDDAADAGIKVIHTSNQPSDHNMLYSYIRLK